MKQTGFLLIILCIVFISIRSCHRLNAEAEYNTKIGSNWELGERASTISQKKEYIHNYADALKASNLTGLNANLIYETPDASFDNNMIALQSLCDRLDSIATMDEGSFEYQTAIQQITQQEQAEAGAMTEVFYDCWLREYHYSFWNIAIRVTFIFIQVILGLGGVICILIAFE